MTALPTSSITESIAELRIAEPRRRVDVLGVLWPLHKLEAVVAALLVFVVGIVLTAATGGVALAPAVLAASATGVATWWVARLVHGG